MYNVKMRAQSSFEDVPHVFRRWCIQARCAHPAGCVQRVLCIRIITCSDRVIRGMWPSQPLAEPGDKLNLFLSLQRSRQH